ncbi:hypothetical protein Agub_g5737, partial [Astrephomene gubernaculifera]
MLRRFAALVGSATASITKQLSSNQKDILYSTYAMGDSALTRAELLHQLQALAQHASANEGTPLTAVAEQLEALARQMRMSCNTSVGGPASTSAPAPAPAAPAPNSGPGSATAAAAAAGVDGGSGSSHLLGTPGAAGEEAAAAAAAAAAAITEVPGSSPGQQPSKKQRRAPREFDFTRYRTRPVALELMYVGWAFQGFARQDNTDNTIEGVFFSALRKVKLIPEAAPVSELAYSRCGRTDAGVSALGQVVALRLRSCARLDEPLPPPESEYDYPRLINKALPPEVRVLGWSPVAPEFNARFSAQYREYKYFIVQQRLGTAATSPHVAPTAATTGTTTAQLAPPPAQQQQQEQSQQQPQEEGGRLPGCAAVSTGTTEDQLQEGAAGAAPTATAATTDVSYSLDLDAMRQAASYFVGEHDFRNFCKPDVTAVRSFRRRILSFTIEPVRCGAGAGSHEVYALVVRGTAFLWHQVRCMAAVLLMVGRRQEAPQVVARLLDVAATPRKPQYSMAPEEPLLLYACGFSDLAFRRSSPAVAAALGDVGGQLGRHLVGAALTAECHTRMAADTRCEDAGSSSGGSGNGRSGGGGAVGGHIPLLRRQTEPSIEERMARRG